MVMRLKTISGALEGAIGYLRKQARPWIDANQEKATDNHYTIAQIL